MENNKLLIGVQFSGKDADGKTWSKQLELYVVRDITLFQLMEGIGYGIAKLSQEDSTEAESYAACLRVYKSAVARRKVDATDYNGRAYLTHVTFTSYDNHVAKGKIRKDKKAAFWEENTRMPLCELGFITSTRILFNETDDLTPRGMLDSSHVIAAFRPETSDKVFFPQYNISPRQLYVFDDTPVEILSATEPPKKQSQSLFFVLLPSVISVVVLLLVRVALMGGDVGSGIAMILFSVATALAAVVTTTFSYFKQKRDYAKSLSDWREQYQNYVDSTLESIAMRQIADARKMDELYPDMLYLICPDERGVYSFNRNMYSRCAQDADFLSFRMGVSGDVDSKFAIRGDAKDVVFSEASFALETDQAGRDHLRIHLRGEGVQGKAARPNLCKLPETVAKKYRKMKGAPLLYSLKGAGALGVVEAGLTRRGDLAGDASQTQYFLSRMIFELCYYHSPEELQFVVFFNEHADASEMDYALANYKFLPHFRGLLDDKSQFVADSASANLVMSSLLSLMNERRERARQSDASPLPHIVLIVFDEHGMKEHAFAEYLPKSPQAGEQYVNDLGLTFVFAKAHREHLPAYCDDVVDLDAMTLSPRRDVAQTKRFSMGKMERKEYFVQLLKAFQFLSSAYYAQVSQNGRVPSSVSMLDLFGCGKDGLRDWIRANWAQADSGVTRSLAVPIGRTESEMTLLDLHERADGPHMLVAGTTGSGKTETIITYLLALCAKFRPDELNLLLVDMKGGGFTKRIGHLPHVVGSVTDVDGDENGTGSAYMLGRFLNAMQAEIKRRKLLFNKMRVDSIDAYIAACRDVDSHIETKKATEEETKAIREAAKSRLSHLILVVDEFAELKRFTSENSSIDFISEITTIARVGRSLGFHIILISQNIEGAITEDIEVNTKARLCLKVATKQASKAMIGTELAASPYMPGNGRAYLLVGTGAKFEYFQSGYSGGGMEEAAGIEMTLASKTGAYRTFYRSDKDNARLEKERKARKQRGLDRTQLDACTEAICETYRTLYAGKSGAQPHVVFHPPLPARIALGRDGKVVVLDQEGGDA